MSYVRNAVVTLVVCLFVAPAFAQGKWTKLAPFPEPSEELLGASAGGRMYVFCGLAPGWVPKGLVYEYDPASDKWAKKKPMALPSHHVAFAELKGKIYAFGRSTTPGNTIRRTMAGRRSRPCPPSAARRWRWRPVTGST